MSPEGTRRRKNSLQDKPNIMKFKKGAFHLAKLAQVEIVPVVIVGSRRIGGKSPIMPKPGSLFVKVCDPIPLSVINSKDVDELISFCHSRFEEETEPKTDKEVLGTYYSKWNYFLGYLCYNIFWIWLIWF